MQYGPVTPLSQEMHQQKYRQTGEDFRDFTNRLAGSLQDNPKHFQAFRDTLRSQRFLPAGRVQTAMGSLRMTTAINCFVSGIIDDSMESIMTRASQAAMTMRLGGGIGYDFSRLRPRGDRIRSLDSQASGPVSFMGIFDAVCQTISSAGHRRGAQMAVLRVDHPDILEFIRAKRNNDNLTGFNISVGVTDRFMDALANDEPFDLTFDGKVYETINPRSLWDEIMRSTFDWAEPGVLFIDRINEMNNLWYCETIEATNPCGEQPLPPFGACLLGSFNIAKYVVDNKIDYNQLKEDIPHVVRAMDNVVDRTIYPLKEQRDEEVDKRRMGLGVTGVANALEAEGFAYGTHEYIAAQDRLLEFITVNSYWASVELAKEKRPFPLFDAEKYCQGKFIQRLPNALQEAIRKYGIRNSHLTSIAPTGTISLTADNVSSGIEPPYTLQYDRTIKTFDGERIERVQDYGMAFLGVSGRTADAISATEHVDVLCAAQKWIDSACSKTCNVGAHVSYEDFKDLYVQAYNNGAKGITTFRAAGKRFGILNAVEDEGDVSEPKAEACTFDPETGIRTCDE